MKCPTCKKIGQKVPIETVRGIVNADCEGKIEVSEFYLCMNPNCAIAYYNANSTFDKSDLKIPLWYKKNAIPKYACYCRKITQEEVTKVVLEKGMIHPEDVMSYLRGGVRSNCKVNNPTGHCCHPAFNEMIEEAIEIKANAEKKQT